MENISIEEQIKENIRIESIKKLTRACKDKLFEDCSKERKQK